MKAYSFDENGIFTGEEVLHVDPLETKKQGKKVYLIPGRTTLNPPPAAQEGKDIKWIGSKWELRDKPKKEEPETPKEPTPKEVEKREKLEKAFANLKKVDSENLSIAEIRLVIKDILTLIAPKE